MVEFKKMWEDVSSMLAENRMSCDDLHIIETYGDGFIVENDGENSFVNKKDFIDFWCKMLYYKQISKEDIISSKNIPQKYVYEIIQSLPYITEESNTLRLIK